MIDGKQLLETVTMLLRQMTPGINILEKKMTLENPSMTWILFNCF
jgi:hypothetical protein